MGTLKNVKEKLKEKEVYRKLIATWIRDLTAKQKYCKKYKGLAKPRDDKSSI